MGRSLIHRTPPPEPFLHPPHIYQGIIASPRGNRLFLHGIRTFVEAAKPLADYFISTKNIYALIRNDTRSDKLTGGLNAGQGVLAAAAAGDGEGAESHEDGAGDSLQPTVFDYVLLEEQFRPIEECPDGKDRYGACVYIYQGSDRVIKGRYSDYPWQDPFSVFFKHWFKWFFPNGHPPVVATKERKAALCRLLGWRHT